MKHTEATIQRELIKWIKQEYPQVEYLYCKNEGKKDAMMGKLDKQMGLLAGFPDLTFFYTKENVTYILHLELKTLKGKLNNNQKKWWSNLEKTSNREGFIAHGFQEAKKYFIKWFDNVR